MYGGENMINRINKSNKKKIIMLILTYVFISCFEIKTVHAVQPISSHGFSLIGDCKDKATLEVEGGPVFNLEGILPGDNWKSSIIFKNISKENKNMLFELNEITNNISDNTLFDMIDVKIYLNNEYINTVKYKEIFRTLENKKYKDGEKLDFIFEFPKECGNYYQNRQLDSTWIFSVRYAGDQPVTNDMNRSVGYVLAATLSGAAIFLILKKKHNETK